MPFAPGLYTDVPFTDYLEDPAIDYSGLKVFSKSPKKFIHWRGVGKPGTPAQKEGSGLHCKILQPEIFAESFGNAPAPRANSKARQGWDRQNPLAQPLTPGQWENVQNMARAFEKTGCKTARSLLTDGTAEFSIWFEDPETGLMCKIRPDYLRNDDIIIDVKSTQTGDPAGFLREIRNWRYDWQAAFYLRGLTAAYAAAGVNRQAQAFIFACVENVPPYLVSTYVLSETMISTAGEQLDEALAAYKVCKKENNWPGYVDDILILGD